MKKSCSGGQDVTDLVSGGMMFGFNGRRLVVKVSFAYTKHMFLKICMKRVFGRRDGSG